MKSEISIYYSSSTTAPSLVSGDDDILGDRHPSRGGWHFVSNKASDLLTLIDEPASGLASYLETYQFEGVGEETAKSIVENGCLKVFSCLNDESANLAEEFRVSKKVEKSLRAGWKVNANERNLRIFLFELGFSNGVINSILDNLGSEILNVLKNRPFDLVKQIPRLNFSDVQEVLPALQLNVAEADKIIAGIHFCLARIENQRGHTAAPIWRVKKDLAEQFEFSSRAFDAALKEAGSELAFYKVNKEEFVQTLAAEARDTEIAQRLRTIFSRKEKTEAMDTSGVDFEAFVDISLGGEQQNALEIAASSPISIITGGPGTGKTSIVIALLGYFASHGRSIHVCAPTGRAAKRLAETPGLEAFKPSTIHMMLRNSPDIDVLVIDEASMVDADLMELICGVLSEKSTLVLIGDPDQLPPVQSGQVFRDLIECKVFPIGRLEKIYRQQSGSDIISAAKRVIVGQFPRSGDGQSERDFSFIEESSEERLEQKILDLYFDTLREQLEVDPITDIQILSPMRKGLVGVDNLNDRIQAVRFARSKPILKRKNGLRLFKGDKIIQTKNNYDKRIMNGDTGFVVGQTEAGLGLSFDGRYVEFSFEDVDSIQLAYAISVHKSQGSEYPAVIIPISRHHQHMLGRNLIYTGITRGRNRVVVAGNRSALEAGINAQWKEFRYSLLSMRLKKFKIK